MSKMPATYEEAINLGYRVNGVRMTRGYVSRKSPLGSAPVHVAGGNRKGQLYVLHPCYVSTQYCYRVYLKSPEV